MTPLAPIFMDLVGRPCLIVGGGTIAEGRARMLTTYGAHVTLVAPDISPGIAQMRTEQRFVAHHERGFRADDLDGMFLVVAATNLRAVNAQVADAARARGVLTNVVDDPESCDVQIPAIVRRGDLTVAISTGGASPVVTAQIRRELEAALRPEWADVLDLLRGLRERTKQRYPESRARAEAIRALLADAHLMELVRVRDLDGATAYACTALDLEGAV